MAKFLSDEWFAKVKELTEDAGEIDIPGPLKDLTINLNVTLADDSIKNVHLAGGQFGTGHQGWRAGHRLAACRHREEDLHRHATSRPACRRS